MSTLTATQLQQQYIAYFGRPGDPAGIKYWLSSSSGITSAREFANKIYAQDEYKTSTVGSKSTEEQVNNLYINLFGRESDAAGLLYWTNEIEKGNLTLSNVATDLIWAASNPSAGNTDQGAADATALTNKVNAAIAYTAEVESSTTAILAYQPETTSPFKAGAAFTSGKTYLATITTTAHTEAGITSTVASMSSASNVEGSRFVLTNSDNTTTGGADNFTGTTGDDTFLANASNSLDNGDVVDGGAGTDSLTARYSVSANKTVNTSITNVENVTIDFDDGDTAAAETLTINTDGFTGLSKVTVKDSSSLNAQQDTVEFTNLAAGVELGVTNGDANMDIDFVYKTTTGTTDTATLNLNTAKADEITIAGIETLTIDGSGGASTIDTMVTTASTKYVITGDKKVTLSNIDDAVKTVDGSASTGGFTIDGVGAVDTTITGGSGNDSVNIGTSLTAKDTIDLGAGTDTLVVGQSQTAALSKLSNIEELELEVANSADGVSLEISGLVTSSITNFIIDSTAGADDADVGLTVSALDSGDTITVISAGSDTTSAADGVALTGTLTTDTTADEITLNLNGIGATSAIATDDTGIAVVTLDSHETINLGSNANADNNVTTNGVESLAVAAATGINITGSSILDIDAITNTTKLVSIDASAATNKVTIDGIDASKITIKAAAKDTTLSMAGLNNDDQIIGGAGTKDYLTATGVTGLTATTGKLNIQDVETVELNATAANTIDASLFSGVNLLAFSGATPGVQTVTGLGTGVAIGIGDAGAEFDNGDDIDVTLADETGTADSVEFKIDNTSGAATDADVLTSSTIETVTLNLLDDDTAANNATISMDKAKAATVTLKGGFAGQSLTLGTLADETLTVDASALDADFSFTAGTTASGMTVTTKAAQADTDITLSAKDDTLTVAETGAITIDMDGGAGTDTLNLSLKAGFVDTDELDNFETINITVRAGDDISLGANGTDANRADAISAATTVVLKGGNALSTFEVGDANAAAADNIATAVDFDASAFEGNIFLEFAADIFTATTDVDAGSLTTDTVRALFDTDATDIVLPLTGVDTFIATLNSGDTGAQEQYNFDVDTATGLTTIAATSSDGENTLLDIDDYVSTVTVQLGADDGTAGAATNVAFEDSSEVDINLKSSAGTADVVNMKLVDTDDSAGTIDVDAAGVETLNIELSTDAESHTLSLAGVAPTSGSNVAINVTKGVAGDGIVISDVHAKVNVIDASALVGTITLSDRGSSAMTITGGSANDTLRMENTADVIDGGAGTGDTLNVVKSAILGGIAIDLSSTTDQITTFNGSANTTITKGFENVDVSGYTGSFGADITGISTGSTITGTTNADVITLEDATTNVDDVIHFDSGSTADQITNFVVGASNDKIEFDLSELEAAGNLISGRTLDFVDIYDNNSVAISDNIVIDDLTAAAAATDTQNLFHINGVTAANADAAVDLLETGGSRSLSFVGNIAANDAFLFAYETGTVVRLAAAVFTAADNNTGGVDAAGAGVLDGVDLMEFTDLTVFDNFVAGNFDLV
jgi:hypothetical protein